MKSSKKDHSRTYVPCNGCTLCCQQDAIRLMPEDNVSDYQTEPHSYIPFSLMLAHKPNGECIYLSTTGCAIHDNAPFLCRNADCRTLALKLNFTEAMELHNTGRLDIRVWERGHDLLKLLERKIKRKK